MNRIERILVATDLSAPARHAAERAGLLSRRTGARLTLLHVHAEWALQHLRGLLVDEGPDYEATLRAAVDAQLADLAAELKGRYGVTPDVVSAEGPVPQAIAAVAGRSGCDLVVVGARGEGFVRHAMLGSTAERLLRHSARPVLVVKQAPIVDYRRVLVSVALADAAGTLLSTARSVAPGAEIVAVHGFEVPFEGKLRRAGVDEEGVGHLRVAAKQRALRELEGLIAPQGPRAVDVRVVVRHGDPARLVVEQEQEQDADLIVLGKRKRSTVETFLLGSVTKKVLGEANGDVLVDPAAGG